MIKIRTQETFIQRWVFIAFVWLGILFLEYLGVLQPVREAGERVLLPVGTRVSSVTYAALQPFIFLETAYKNGSSIQSLQQQLSTAQSELAELQGVKQENEALRALFKNTDRTWQATLLASPIVSFGNPAIAVGSQSGINPGDAVLNFGTLVGRVGTVSEHQSEVLLLSSVSTPFLLARSESGVTGIVRGTGQQIIFTEVNRSSQVEVGELVVTSGQAGVPKDIPIGTIRTQTSTAAEPVLTFQLNQPVTFYESSVVEVLPSGQ